LASLKNTWLATRRGLGSAAPIDIDIYVAMTEGVWIYEPKAHAPLPYLGGDIRADTGVQDRAPELGPCCPW
jgi:hypothetical protein